MSEETFYTVKEFAKLIRVHPNTVSSGIKKGRIQAFRVGVGMRSDYRIPSTEVSRMSEMDMTKIIERIVDEKLEKMNEVQRM